MTLSGAVGMSMSILTSVYALLNLLTAIVNYLTDFANNCMLRTIPLFSIAINLPYLRQSKLTSMRVLLLHRYNFKTPPQGDQVT